MKTFKEFQEQLVPGIERVNRIGADGKVRTFTPPIDLRTDKRKQQAVKMKAVAKFGRP